MKDPVARIAGCDLGKAAAKLAVGTLDADGRVTLDDVEIVAHHGDPLAVFADWYRRADIASCVSLGVTGLCGSELSPPAVVGLPEDACLEAALGHLGHREGPLNVIRIGARGYSVLTRSEDGRSQYLENDKCSSGTGETMLKIAGRFGLSLEEADELACSAKAAIPITARCSVFAKSEMTHFGNQGKPAADLFKGYFEAVASFAAALLARSRVPGPVLLIGGGSQLRALHAGLERALERSVEVPEHALALEAIGAMLLAAEQSAVALPAEPELLVHERVARFRPLDPAGASAHRVRRLTQAPVSTKAAREPSILGLDLGSTGSKAVLTSLGGGDPVLSLYDRTRGNPVDAAQRLIRAVLHATEPDVRAVGVTGSGREAAATVLRAAYPELAERIVVVNEIVAHATAAIRCDEDGGESLSVVEIGGQDAKFIQIAGGQIVESDMNKACSAGTGSFLEEQSVLYGVHAIEEFTALAERAKRPPDLGQMCTVFVADAAAEAQNEGFGLEDLFAGFQYSVIHNYVNRVMGQRSFGRRIFFQGKPASSPSLSWALAQVAGREVIVPPDPGAMGAWGIGLVARAELGSELLARATPFDLSLALEASVVDRKELRCHDRRCQTLCTIEKTRVRVGEETHSVLSGGACPKYEISSAGSQKLPKDAPSAFDSRQRALEPYLVEPERAGDREVGVPLLGACFGLLPWLVTLLRELGLRPRVLRSDAGALARGEQRCSSFDACAPAKIVHGVLDTDLRLVFFPKILSLPDREGPGGASCPMEQALPEMVRESLRSRGRETRIVHPELSLRDGLASPALALTLAGAAQELGADARRLPAALRAAEAAQQRYERELAGIGERTLAYAKRHELPVVVVTGALHVVHDSAVNASIPQLLREGGALALPMDCYPIPQRLPTLPRVGWADANRALRTAVAARASGGVYPLMLTAFGCGPASFSEQIFGALLEGYPHTVLESDGHGGAAGYVTRVQAFLHTVKKHDRLPSPASRERLALLEPLDKPPQEAERDSRWLLFAFSDHISPILAAAYRSFGFDATASAAPNADSLRLGRKDCSGKECLPYQLIWGSFRKSLEEEPPSKRTLLVQVSGDGKCRNCMFSVKDQLSVERMGLSHSVVSRHFGNDEHVDPSIVFKVWTGMTLWDLVFQLASHQRPLEKRPGATDELYASFCDEIERWTERPLGSGFTVPLTIARARSDALALAERAAAAFAEVADDDRRTTLRTVLLSGDIYVRIDTFSNGDLVRRLNERELKVLVEPTWTLSDYMAEERLSEILGLPTGFFRNAVTKSAMKAIRHEIYARAARRHAWLTKLDTPELLQAADPLLHRHPQGEAPVTIGSVLHAWQKRACDGVVVASPWGCAPALVSESLLRSRKDIPLLFLYADGSPLDLRKLDAFAFRLKRRPAVA